MPEPTQEPKDMQFQPSPEFLARKKRLDDALSLSKPDRVPVLPLMTHYYPTRTAGISNKEAGYNTKKTMEVWRDTIIKHGWDGAVPFGSILPVRPLDILGI